GMDFDGSYGEYTVLPKSIVSPFHSALAWPTLGALPEMFQTAHGSLYSALGVKRGERLLIRGGTSSVGLLATQMAAAEGITVIATTRTPEKRAVLLKNGASDVLIDQGVLRDNLPQSVDKVLELVGTTTLGDSLRCVRPGGTVCMAGMLSEQWSMKDFSPMDFIPSSVNLTIYDSGQMRVEPSAFQEFLNRVSAGEITPPIKAVFRLDQINEAHRLMESNSGAGKIVVYL
ncbi:MAG: NADPH:quinone reductase, partial [Chitinophagaceae bacterium]